MPVPNSVRTLLKTCIMVSPLSLFAAGDLSSQKPVVIDVYLSNKNDQLAFFPNILNFETGKLYQLKIHNQSKQKHYFTSEGLARSVFTRKVEISNNKKTLVEVKGYINEIEVYPDSIAQWWFVPIKTLQGSRLHCSIKGHAEAGMQGIINIK